MAFCMLLAACASVPVASPEMDMKAKNMTPPPGKALLYVYRGAVFVSSAVLFEIGVDGQAVGQLAEKTYLTVVVEPGRHRVDFGAAHVDINHRYHNPQNITFKADTTYYAEMKVLPDSRIVMVGQDIGRKALAGYTLIHDSEEPMQVTSRKEKSTTAGPASSTVPEIAAAGRTDIDELPVMKINGNKNSCAIVIGIENYRQKLPRADFATKDAQLVADYLVKVLGYPEENVVTLVNDRAAKSDFEKYFERWLLNNVEPGGTVFVYYSGHGAPDPRTGGAYLVPYDGDPSFIAETGYSLQRMYDALGKLPAKEVIVALDSCFSGAGGRSVLAKGARPLVMNLRAGVVTSKNMVVLAASSGDQTSSTYDEKGHGLFTYFLLKGIKNEDVVHPDGTLGVDALFDYVKPQVERIARKQYNNEQTPQLMVGK
jgi:hypothetical protein